MLISADVITCRLGDVDGGVSTLFHPFYPRLNSWNQQDQRKRDAKGSYALGSNRCEIEGNRGERQGLGICFCWFWSSD